MAKLTLADIGNLLGNPTSAATSINNNSSLIEAALEKTLSRDGTTPNQMLADFDMNLNDILNASTMFTQQLYIGGQELKPSTFFFEPTYQRSPASLPRSLFDLVTERVSILDYIPKSLQAGIRNGSYSGDLAPYFQACVDDLNPGGSNIPGGAMVFIPSGRYCVASPVPLQDSIEWIGENKEGTRFQALGNHPVFKSVGTSSNQVGRASVQNMTIRGAGKSNLYGYGVELVWMNNPLLRDVQFQNLRWCIVQEYVVNAFIFDCSSNGSGGTIRGYLWKKAINKALFTGFDNTTTMADVYFMAGDIALLLHGSNGIQMGGNVALLQGGVRVGAFAETLPDGTVFTPGLSWILL